MDYRKRRAKQAPINIEGGCSGAGREFQVPWCAHHQLTIMVQTHQGSREEGMVTHFPHQETEKICHGSLDPEKVLQLHHREHHDWLHHCLVWQLLGLLPQGTTECSAHGPVHHWGQASCLPGPLYRALSEEGPKIVKDSSHPSHKLFFLLPHSKRYRSAKSRSKRLLKQVLPPSHKTPEHLIKWLPRLIALPPTLFYAAVTLCCYLCIVTSTVNVGRV